MISQVDTHVITAPSFVVKLWDMLNNSSYERILSWSADGESFVIKDKDKFTNELLPQYFKHNNLSSFIRQLNKYGFRKIHSFENNFEFYNENFIRDEPLLLAEIKRKQTELKQNCSNVSILDLLNKVQDLKKSQEVFENKANAISKQQETLCKETKELKKKQQVQQKIINNIMAFLANVVHQDERDVSKPVSYASSNNSNKNLMAITLNPHSETKDQPNLDLEDDANIIFLDENQEDDLANVFTNSDPKMDVELPTSGVLLNSPNADRDSSLEKEKGDNGNYQIISEFNEPKFVMDELDNRLDEDLDELVLSPADDIEIDNEIIQTLESPQLDLSSIDLAEPIAELDLGNLTSLNPVVSNVQIDMEPDVSAPFSNNSYQHITNNQIEPYHSENAFLNKSDSTSEATLSRKEELGEHVDLIESGLNDLKDIMSDTNLNLDMNEVMELFSPEELSEIVEALQ